jgi:hypothetical protein
MIKIILFVPMALFVLISFAQVRPDNKRLPVRKVPAKEEAKTAEVKVSPVQNSILMNPAQLHQIKNFKPIKIGSISSKEGEKELTVADNKFPEQHKSTSTKITEKKVGNMMCSTERLRVEVKTSDFQTFIQTGVPDWLKPGIVMQASSFISNAHKIESSWQRHPITLATTLRGVETTFLEVKNPELKHQITQAESNLISQKASQPAAMMNFTFQEIKSAEELDFRLNGKVSSSIGKLTSEIGLSYTTKKEDYFYMVEFHQTMFSIEVDGMADGKIFIDDTKNTDGLVYLSKVNYGRRGFIVFKTKKSLEEMGAKINASGGTPIVKANVNSSFNLLKNNSEVEIFAFYYGGSTESAAASIRQTIEKGNPGDITTYIEGRPFDHTLAMPVGYELKNIQGQRVGLGSNFEKLIETCVPWKSDILKLKVTLTDIQCIVTADGDKVADYGVRQHVMYKAKGKEKMPASKNLTKHGGDCPLGSDTYWVGSTALICGGSNKQIHVNQGNKRNANIDNSVIFHITPEEYNDKNAEFIINTWVKEYNGGSNDLVLNNDPSQVKVAIKDVLDILSGVKNLNTTGSYKLDNSIGRGHQFDFFDGMKMPLTKVNSTKPILEGVIRARNKGANLTDKAAVWVRFELID